MQAAARWARPMSERPHTPMDESQQNRRTEQPESGSANGLAGTKRLRVGLLGVSGYTGQVLLGLLRTHPTFEPVLIPWRTPADLDTPAATNDDFSGSVPRRGGFDSGTERALAVPDDPAGLHHSAGRRAMLAGLDAIALALPSDASASWVPSLLELGVPRVLDLSDHHRQVDGVHYGLPELFGAPPSEARLVANPGCYPTATLLPLVPLLRARLVDFDGIAVVGASGASGAGKGLADHLHFCNLVENVFPYKVGTHRHVPEIERHATIGASGSSGLSNPSADVTINFVTQLLPIVRGMLVTSFVRTRHEPKVLLEALRTTYASSPWISVVDVPDQNMGLRHVVGTHQAVIGVGPTRRSGLVPVFCSIDNLMRGASSQALHNLNLWFGLPEAAGLPLPSPPPMGVPIAFAAAIRSTDRDVVP